MDKKRMRARELACQALYGSKKGSRGKTIILNGLLWDTAEDGGDRRSTLKDIISQLCVQLRGKEQDTDKV